MEVNPALAENVTLFSAASGTEISSAWPEKQHGLFTYWMLKGLQGKADANRDQSLTVQELSDYIQENCQHHRRKAGPGTDSGGTDARQRKSFNQLLGENHDKKKSFCIIHFFGDFASPVH
jgi:hypothetical protein